MNDNTKEIEEKKVYKKTKEKYPYMIKMAEDFGYKGNINDQDALMKFIWHIMGESAREKIRLDLETKKLKEEAKQKNLEIEKLKKINAYEKQLTSPNLDKTKQYNTRYNKPNINIASPEVIPNVLALNMEEFNKGGNLNVATSKFIDNALVELTKQTAYKETNAIERFTAAINIRNYLISIGKEPTPGAINEFKKQVRTKYTPAIKSLYVIELKGKLKGKMQLISNILYDNKNIYVYFFPEYAKWLTFKGKIKHHAKCLNLLQEPDANAYYLGTTLETYYGLKRNRLKNRYNKRSVENLLEYCSTIPTENNLKAQGDRHYKRKIIDPFQAALNKLSSIGFMKWEYTYQAKKTLNEKEQSQLDNKNITDFKLFKKLYITYELNNFPRDIEPLEIEKKG